VIQQDPTPVGEVESLFTKKSELTAARFLRQVDEFSRNDMERKRERLDTVYPESPPPVQTGYPINFVWTDPVTIDVLSITPWAPEANGHPTWRSSVRNELKHSARGDVGDAIARLTARCQVAHLSISSDRRTLRFSGVASPAA
jgi:hypothetical protein